jgi:hypothetical protein
MSGRRRTTVDGDGARFTDGSPWALRTLDWIGRAENEIGLLPAGADEAEALYRLVDAAYERRSLILTANLHPARFDSIFPKGLATAAVDRLLHHAHVIVTEGRSHRLTETLDGRGVTPLEVPDV